MLSFRMPFASVPCGIWYANDGQPDAYGNSNITYNEKPDVETRCVYAPGTSMPDTADDVEDGRPHGDSATMTFYLPKDFQPTANLRDALIACYPTSDTLLSGRQWRVVGDPVSYQRENVPGDYSWVIKGVAWLG